MALKIYTDAAATLEALSNEVFSGTGAQYNFGLVSLLGTKVGDVYLEDFATYAAGTFTNGVSSPLAAAPYAANAAVGQRIYHNDIFVGTVASNTAIGTVDNQAIAIATTQQTATATVGGTFEVGDAFTVTLGGTAFTHTVVAGNTDNAGIATAIAALIDAHADYVATASAAVVTVTRAAEFTISTSTTNVAAGNADQTLVSVITSITKTATLLSTAAFDIGDVYTLVLDGTTCTHVVTSGNVNISGIATALELLTEEVAGVASSAVNNVITMVKTGATFTLTASATNGVCKVTLDDLTYNNTAFNIKVSNYTKKTLTTHYSISGNTVIFVTAPTTSQKVHVVPDDTLNINFGGNPGADITTTSSVWLKRTAGFTYDTLKFYVEDLSAVAVASTTTGTTFASGVGSGFVGLVADSLIGLALDHKGVFRGMITDNDATTVTISDAGYTDAVAGDSHVYSVSQVLCSLDNVTFKTTAHPAAINNDTAVRVYLKDTVKVPNAAANYPNLTVRVSGIEYLS
jgi:hypothetical protein